MININKKRFRSINNTHNGEVNGDTIFEYHQNGKLVWATYSGGAIKYGTLMGTMNSKGVMRFNYQHINNKTNIKLAAVFQRLK